MSKLSDYLENKLIDHIFRSTTFAQPAGIYLALGTAAADGSFTELVGGGYARINCGRGDATWNKIDGSCQILGPLSSGTASADWGDISHFALYDAASGGSMLAWGTLTKSAADQPCRVYAGEQFSVPTYGLIFGIN